MKQSSQLNIMCADSTARPTRTMNSQDMQTQKGYIAHLKDTKHYFLLAKSIPQMKMSFFSGCKKSK